MNERIKMVREHFKLSRAAFGEKLGVSGDVVNNAERGRVKENTLFIEHLCSVFNVDEHWLRTGEGEMFLDDRQSVVDRLSREYSFSDTERQMLLSYLSLPAVDRAAIVRYVQSLAAELNAPPMDAATAQGIATVKEYADMVSEEKDTATSSSSAV